MSRFCTKCGSPVQPDARFCARCGAPETVPEAPPASGIPAVEGGESGFLAWQIDVSLLGNRFLRGSIVSGFLLAAALTGLLLGAIFGFSSGDLMNGLLGFAIGAGASLALMTVGLMGFFVLVGFRQPIAYSLDSEGVRMLNASQTAKGIHRAALILGFLARKPSVIAAGATSMASETRSCLWDEARAVEEYPEERTLVVKGGLLSTVQVFCTPENYEQVRAFVLEHTKRLSRP